MDATFDTIVVILGVAYLITGVFLFRNSRTATYFGVIAPIIGLCVGLCGGMTEMSTNPTARMAFLGAIDAAIVLGRSYLIKRKLST
jgi:uncharacterized membrane protein